MFLNNVLRILIKSAFKRHFKKNWV